MRKLFGDIVRVFKRVIDANLRMEHYWFFPKPMAVAVKRAKRFKKN